MAAKDDLAFIANRIRELVHTEPKDDLFVVSVWRLVRKAIDLGAFADVLFTEFNTFFDPQRESETYNTKRAVLSRQNVTPNFVSKLPLTMLSAMKWLADHGENLGLSMPRSLPKLGEFESVTMGGDGVLKYHIRHPNRDTLRPHVEFLASLIEATGQGDAVSDDTTPPKPEHEFRPNGDGYDITFYESGHVSAFRCKGLHQIHRLIETPMVPVLMTELEGARLDDPHSRQDVADQDTLRDVAGKLREAKSELDRATASQNHDTIDVEHCRQEVEKWEDELGKLLGLRGQVRDLNNPYDKKRPKIWGTINTAKKRLREFGHSELADHLDGSIDSERAWFVYVPKLNPIPNWKTEKKDASLRP